jgi:hypothetical protein
MLAVQPASRDSFANSRSHVSEVMAKRCKLTLNRCKLIRQSLQCSCYFVRCFELAFKLHEARFTFCAVCTGLHLAPDLSLA